MKNIIKIAMLLVFVPTARGQYGLYRSGGAIARHGVPTAARPVDSPGHGTYAGAQTVSITTSTSGAAICYTVDGSTPAASTPGTCSHGTTYSGSFTSPGSTFTLKAIATKAAFINSGLDTSVYTINPTAATPVDSPGAGTYPSAQSITITTATSGARICYTVDGSTPAATTPGTCSHGTSYVSAFTSPSSTFTLKAIATKAAFFNSGVDTSVYTILPTAATPADSPGAGTYPSAQTITITTATSGATICYTVDGSTPAATTPGTCSHGTTYASAFTSPSSTFTLKALASKTGFFNSAVDSSTYTIDSTAATPVDSPGAGTYSGAQTITITTATSGATICYTVDGTTPAASIPGTCSAGTAYSGAFTSPSSTFTLKALATKTGFFNSAIDTSTYTISPTAATPVDSPGSGTYSGAQTISITTATSGATICYTIDGSTPAASTPGACSAGTTYSGAFTSPGSTFTLKALATRAGFFNSGIDTSVYTITPAAATPVDSPGAGTYSGAQTITITTATGGATICYTVDGSTPTATTPGTCSHGTTYTGAFTSPGVSFVLNSIATKAGLANSGVKSSGYAITRTFTAATCNQSDVQTAVNAEQALPADGDIIAIPPGTCTWTGTNGISQTFANSVTIQGAGAISSTTGGASTTGSDVTAITDHISSTPDLALTTVAAKSLRVTGIALLQDAGSTRGANNGMLQVLGASTSVRVDHNHFYTYNGGVGFRLDGSLQGVGDHDYYNSPSSSVTNDLAVHNGETWLGDTAGFGDESWVDGDHFGTIQFFFIEDCRFYNGYVLDAHDGARYVFRDNTVTGDGSSAQQVTGHGLTDSRGRAVRTVELYQNTFSTPTAIGNPTFSLNSGALLFWGNTISQYKGAIEADYTRKSNATYTYLAPPNGWGYCGTAFGPTNWDENLDSTGYPCLDAAARGAGGLLVGNFPTVCDQTVGCPTYTGTWPSQALDPAYVWDNAYTLPYAGVNLIVIDTSMYQNNRDYYQQFGTFANSGSFNGTAGVGQGLFSAIPSTCTAGPGGNTPGVAYWATDQNKLYVCNPTNTWTVYYTPYTYPHPLNH